MCFLWNENLTGRALCAFLNFRTSARLQELSAARLLNWCQRVEESPKVPNFHPARVFICISPRCSFLPSTTPLPPRQNFHAPPRHEVFALLLRTGSSRPTSSEALRLAAVWSHDDQARALRSNLSQLLRARYGFSERWGVTLARSTESDNQTKQTKTKTKGATGAVELACALCNINLSCACSRSSLNQHWDAYGEVWFALLRLRQTCWEAPPTTAAWGCWFHRAPPMTGAWSSWPLRPCTRTGASRRARNARSRPRSARDCWGPLSPRPQERAQPPPRPASGTGNCKTASTTCWRDHEDGPSSTTRSCESPLLNPPQQELRGSHSALTLFWQTQRERRLTIGPEWNLVPVKTVKALNFYFLPVLNTCHLQVWDGNWFLLHLNWCYPLRLNGKFKYNSELEADRAV